jgi:hypothetical protein
MTLIIVALTIVLPGKTLLSTMTLNLTSLRIMTLGKMQFNITTLTLMTVKNDTHHSRAQHNNKKRSVSRNYAIELS